MGINISGLQAHSVDQFVGTTSVFDCDPTYSLACFATVDFSLSSRLEAEFKSRYGGSEWLKVQGAAAGIGKAIQVSVGNRKIYYLTVKKSAYAKATAADLLSALNDMKAKALVAGVTNIAVPNECFAEISEATLASKLDECFSLSGVNYHICIG